MIALKPIGGWPKPGRPETPLDIIAAAVAAYVPTRAERIQLAALTAELAASAIRAGDLSEAALFLDDAALHVREAREAGR